MEERLGSAGDAPRRARPRSNSRMEFDEHAMDERAHDGRETDEDRETWEDERLHLFLDTQHQTVLPSLPDQDGYHLCWLSTTNPRDTIPYRLSIGYQLIRLKDQPNWAGVNQGSSNYADYVTVQEMIAARIPYPLWQKLMRAVHHSMPLREESGLKARTDNIREQADRQGAYVTDIGDGQADPIQRGRPGQMFQ